MDFFVDFVIKLSSFFVVHIDKKLADHTSSIVCLFLAIMCGCCLVLRLFSIITQNATSIIEHKVQQRVLVKHHKPQMQRICLVFGVLRRTV